MTAKKNGKKWFENYLPFIARGLDAKIEWLLHTLRKEVLTCQEIRPYIHLLLADCNDQDAEELGRQLTELDEDLIIRFIRGTDIHDTPRLFKLLRQPTVRYAMEALGKEPAPYEKEPDLLMDRIFDAIHDHSETLADEAMAAIKAQGSDISRLEKSHERFKEILSDRMLLSTLYPRASKG